MAGILLIGLGDLGSAIAAEALQTGIMVSAMRRQPKGLPGVCLLQHDATTPWPPIAGAVSDVVLCVAPDTRSDNAYRQGHRPFN